MPKSGGFGVGVWVRAIVVQVLGKYMILGLGACTLWVDFPSIGLGRVWHSAFKDLGLGFGVWGLGLGFRV